MSRKSRSTNATQQSNGGSSRLGGQPDFSLVQGGLLHQLLRRAHLSDDELAMLRQRVVIITLLAWLPLLALSALEGSLWGGDGRVPFLRDVAVHIRLLVVLPLLIIAELVVHRRMRPLLKQFLERKLIPENAIKHFEAVVASAVRLRNWVVIEVLLIAFVYGVVVLIVWRRYAAIDTAVWYAAPSADSLKLSIAGIWYGFVSLPILYFLLCRWYFRLFIWMRFLWQVSRIELVLVPTHPDHVGGLGFLPEAAYAFTALAGAHGTLMAGMLANRIFFVGDTLPDFKVAIAVLVIFLACAILGPFLVFGPRLAEAKRRGLREYGTLAERYVREFDAKWLRGGAHGGEPLLGCGDIQSLADLANSYQVVQTMKLTPITKQAVLGLAAATLLPIAPLLLTMMPLHQLLQQLARALF
jgi:hypothetical protein